MRLIFLSVFLGFAGVAMAKGSAVKTEKGKETDLRGTPEAPLVVAPIEVKTLAPVDPRGTAQQPLVITPLSISKSSEEANHETWRLGLDIILTMGTVVLAIVTAGLWYSTYCLAKDAKETSSRQASETARSLDISRQAADAAQKTAAVMDETAIRELRAYLSIFPRRLNYFTPGYVPTVDFDIINNGLTPAIDVVTSGLVDVCAHPLPPGYPVPDLIREKAVFPVHPRNPMNGVTRANRIFQKKDIDKCFVGSTHRLYVFARVDYKDVYGNSRSTTICTYVSSVDLLGSLAQGMDAYGSKLYFAWADQLNVVT